MTPIKVIKLNSRLVDSMNSWNVCLISFFFDTFRPSLLDCCSFFIAALSAQLGFCTYANKSLFKNCVRSSPPLPKQILGCFLLLWTMKQTNTGITGLFSNQHSSFSEESGGGESKQAQNKFSLLFCMSAFLTAIHLPKKPKDSLSVIERDSILVSSNSLSNYLTCCAA